MIHPSNFSPNLSMGFVGALVLTVLLSLDSPSRADDYVTPLSLISDTVAGVVVVPDMPEFCAAWKTTTLSAFANDDLMKLFVEAQRARAEQELLAADLKVGIKLRDLLEIASGEAVLAWQPFKDPRRPYSIAIVADVRELYAKAQAAIEQVDKDLVASGATRKDVKRGDDAVRVYALKPKPGQLRIEQVAICLNKDRILASDRESIVMELLDAVDGKSAGTMVTATADFKRVREQIADRPKLDEVGADAGVVGLQWFARPLAMARIAKEAIGVDRGNQVDVVNLLERQGFDAIRAAGGEFTIGHRDFDLLHYGFVLAPPVTSEPSRYRLAARMLQFPNSTSTPIPRWVGKQIASYTRLNWNLSEAFWAAETLVDDALGQAMFKDMLDGIRDDEVGPRIDVAKNVVPNLGGHLILLTDNELPASESSERLLVAIEITSAQALRDAVKRMMEVEPDAALVDGVPGVEVYRVLKTDEPTDFDAELFDDLGLGDAPDPDAPPPLLNQWAISVIANKSDKGGYLVFSSHPELLVETANRMLGDAQGGLGDTPEFKLLGEHLTAIGGDEFAIQRLVRIDLSLRVKYALLREGKLRDSDSLLASLFRRAFDKIDAEGDDPLGAKKLPPIEDVEKFFRPAGTYLRTTDDGWSLDGFLLK